MGPVVNAMGICSSLFLILFSIHLVNSFSLEPILQSLGEAKSHLETQLSFPTDIKIVSR